LEDYYAILGLDPGASPESIKLAYRRLARESHPDLNINSTEEEKRALSLHMSQLNGAYAVLSDATRKREYDEKLRILGALKGNTVSNVMKAAVTKAATKSKTSHCVRPSHDADSTMVHEFSRQLRSNFLTNRKGFSWKEIDLEGFDWGLECVSWTSHYCVAARGFAVLDPTAAKKFANYSEVVVARCNRSMRRSYFLFLLPFQNLSQWEFVSAGFNRLFSAENREARLDVPVGIVLFDSQRGRTLRVGSQLKEKHFEELLLCLDPELMISR
jgi:curved DNA-binding protein CbpA